MFYESIQAVSPGCDSFIAPFTFIITTTYQYFFKLLSLKYAITPMCIKQHYSAVVCVKKRNLRKAYLDACVLCIFIEPQNNCVLF